MDTIPQDDPESQSHKQKFCNGCHQHKEATREFFFSDRSKRDGWSTLCKICQTPEGKQRRVLEQARNVPPDGYQRCTSCSGLWPATPDYFYFREKGRNKLHAECKTCQDKRIHAYLEEHPTYWHDWYTKDAEEQKQRVKMYTAANKDKVLSKRRKYYQLHAEEGKAYSRQYNKTHPEWRRVHGQNRRFRKKSVKGTHTPSQIANLLKRQKYRCYYAACGHTKFEKKNGKYIYQIEHTYPLSRVIGTDIPANDINYIVLSCPSCNNNKKAKFPWEWPEGGRLL